MKNLNAYSTVVGELPKLVRQNKAQVFIPYNEVLEFKEQLMNIFSDTSHTAYQNKCYAEFLLRKIGM